MPSSTYPLSDFRGRGWRDTVFVERLWRTIKYVEVYFKTHESVVGDKQSIGIYVDFYNQRRPHSSLDGVPSEEFYYNARSLLKPA